MKTLCQVLAASSLIAALFWERPGAAESTAKVSAGPGPGRRALLFRADRIARRLVPTGP